MNRLTQSVSNSFTYNYTYDWTSQNFSGVTNSIGRLSYSTNNTNAAQVHSYDPMGRVAQESYWTPQNPNWNTSVSASYDLAGQPISLTYPDGRKVSHTFDPAGRLSTVNYASWNGSSVGTPYLTVNSYDPVGHVDSATTV